MSLKRYKVVAIVPRDGEQVAEVTDYGDFVATTPELAIQEAIDAKASWLGRDGQASLRSRMTATQVSYN